MMIKALRREGRSIIEIMNTMSLAKTTVWHHVQDVELTIEQENIILSRRGGSNRRKNERIDIAKRQAKELIASPYSLDIVSIAMLYWGEGHKKSACSLTNTDPVMIRVYLKVLRSVLMIPDRELFIEVRIFAGMNSIECLRFWSEVTNIGISDIKLRVNDGGTSGRSQYGICRVTIRKGHQYLKLLLAIYGEVSEKILSPRSSMDQNGSVLRI